MTKLLILAALMLSVIGGLTLMSSSSPLAAQTDSATRSLDSSDVEPGATVTVTITLASDYAGNVARVAETLPSGFAYVDDSVSGAILSSSDSGVLRFNLFSLGGLSGASFSYQATASMTDGDYEITGELTDSALVTHTLAATSIKVSTTPPQTGPQPAMNDLQFDVVPASALKGATVSSVGNPIESAPLMWSIDTEMTRTGDIEGSGDFQVVETSAGSNTFYLEVAKSGAPNLDGSQSISVDLTYVDSDGMELTTTLTGAVNERAALAFDNEPFEFTVPQNIADGTPIGNFAVSNKLADEYLDGIISGSDASPFGVNDSDMTIFRKNGAQLEVKDYEFKLTVNGDAGIAGRVLRSDVKVIVTASNQKHTAPGTFEATILENMTGAGLVSGDTPVGDASMGVMNPDGDALTYSIEGSTPFVIDDMTGEVTVGSDGIGDDDASTYNFDIKVSDNVSANDATIAATVTVDVNDPVSAKDDDLPDGVTEDDGTYSFSTEPVAGTANNVELLDLSRLVDAGEGDADTLNYHSAELVPGVPLLINDSGMLILTHVPRAVEDELKGTYDIDVAIGDGFNPADGTDVTISISLTVNVKPKPAQSTPSLSADIDENMTGEVQGALADLGSSDNSSLAALQAEIALVEAPDMVSYFHTGGTNGGQPGDDAIFSVDVETGAISLDEAQNADTLTAMPSVVLQAERKSDRAILGTVFVSVEINDVNEAPEFASDTASAWVSENAIVGSAVKVSSMDDADDFMLEATDDDSDALTYTTKSEYFSIMGTALVVNNGLDADAGVTSHDVVITVSDGELSDTLTVKVAVGDANDDPEFVDPSSSDRIVSIEESTATIDENAAVKVVDFKVVDTDGLTQELKFSLDDGVSQNLFEIKSAARSTTDANIWMGELWAKAGLNYENEGGAYPYNPATGYTVLVLVNDGQQGDDTLTVHVTLNDLNDNAPMFSAKGASVSVQENSKRGTALTSSMAPGGMYVATDADGTAPNNTITYSLSGDDSKSFSIDASTGKLMTLESLDNDGARMPCGDGCHFTIVATDGGDPSNSGKLNVTVSVTGADDSVSNFGISKANPIANISSMGDDAMSALADAKTTMSAAVPESPADLPAMMHGSAPRNFVTTDWANWNTVLRIEVTSESPDPDCGNGNQCVFIDLDADSSGDDLKMKAFRSSMQENLFIAAVKLVPNPPAGKPEMGTSDDSAGPVYMHAGGGVAQLVVDEEDDIEIRLIELVNNEYKDSKVAPISVQVENEVPEFGNFMPEHESAFDDGDVDYTFTITDTVSGVPEPEDLPDGNGDADYMPLVALVSSTQCKLDNDDNDKAYSNFIYAGTNSIWCKSAPNIWPITDDRDFDEIDDGFEVDTKIVLDENEHHYVTFVACDIAGNCYLYTPDTNTPEEAFAQITVDTENPKFVEARTGKMWDSTDEEIDSNKSTWIQLIFTDLSVIDAASVEADDFVVSGHTVKQAVRYGDDADGEDKGANTERMIFLELEDELAPDEEPDVTLVPNGIADKAGNEEDEGDVEAKDYIAPSFTVVSIVSPRSPDAAMDAQLAGDDDEVVITITSDERIRETRPTVTVTHVDAPASSVFTAVNRATCDDEGDNDGYRVRGEIVHNDNCQDADAAQGGTLGTTISKVSNTEWIVIVKEPEATGYYNIFIEASDRSAQNNQGDEGVAPADIVVDFFERDGDVNTDDAHFFQGDINLPNPAVSVSGKRIEDTEPAVEFKTPLFVEIDFTKPYLRGCEGIEPGSDEYKAKCYAEKEEYAKDSFETVTITSFMLNGVDMTDSVKTTDNKTFLVSINNPGIQDHEIEIQAVDEAGNDLDSTLSVEFEVEERDDFSKRLSPGWNLVSIPGEPADSDISTVFGADVEVRTVYTYNPIIPGGWMVAVRESVDSEWQGDLKEITARQGYWVLSDAIQDWDVSIPRLAGGAVGTGTPIQPPVIALYAGWNLVPVIDVTGDFDGDGISATAYLQSLDDGLDLARVLGFDTITNTWSTIMAPEGGSGADTLEYGSAYWVFVRQAASLVPGN